MRKKTLYFFILGFALTGYAWIALNYQLLKAERPALNVCLFKLATGLPCPSCGTTHSVISITRGNFKTAVHQNILGFPAAILLLVLPVWVLFDLILRKEHFYVFYLQVESFLRKKIVAFPLIIFILANWAWHIYQSL